MNTIDPLAYAKRLTAVGVPAQQAQVHAELIKELLAAIAIERLETKVDKGFDELNIKIDRGLDELNTKIDKVRDELNTKIDKVRDELNAKIDKVRDELNTKIDQVRDELNTKIDRTKAELEAKIDNAIAELRRELMAEINKAKWSCVRWSFGIAVAVSTIQGAAIVMAMRWLGTGG